MKRNERLETIAIIGAGRLGSSLARKLAGAGCAIREIVCRPNRRSRARAARLAGEVNASVSTASRAHLAADVIWFCVPDSEIATAAASFAGRDWRNKIALHASGVLSSDALQCLQARGARVASVHPLMTFVEGSQPSLEGVPFAIEGDVAAVRVANRIVRSLGGRVLTIRAEDKVAYHTFATMVCPLLIALLATAENVAGLAGLPAREARRRMLPILRETLANYQKLGAASFSGPLVRGDVATIEQHLSVLNRAPEAERVYSALAEAALQFLSNKNRRQIARLLRQRPDRLRQLRRP